MPALELNNLTRRFGDFVAVNNVSLQIKQGAIYGFLGPNGSGKSTTIRMLCGLLEPTSGSGKVLGLDIAKDSEVLKQKIGYMSQKFSLYDDLSVIENLRFYGGLYSLSSEQMKKRIGEMLALSGLEKRQQELVANLSGGWKQRLALACSILHNPSILFLDEPTGGVDPVSRRMFWEIIYDLSLQGTTVMVTTHFMDEAEHCDKIGFIYDGALIVDDTPANLKRQIPGVLVEIPAPEPMNLFAELQSLGKEFLDLYPYGSSVHVLVNAEQQTSLAGYDYRVISPSLEDVFVYFVKTRRKERGA